MATVDLAGEGEMLQKLYEKYRTSWKKTDVPGKFVLKRVGDGFPPEALCETAGLNKLKPELVQNKDVKLSFVSLEGGGGLLSISNTDGTFTHFLTTKNQYEARKASMLNKGKT